MLNNNNDAARMMTLFAGNGSAHGTHGEPYQDKPNGKWEIKKTARTIMEPVTEELWQLNIDGERPLGIIPIRDDSTIMWGSIDVDVYGGDHAELIERVYASRLPLVPCRSKSGGLHLFLFLLDPQQASAVRAVLQAVAKELGLKKGTEIFPKQDRLGDGRRQLAAHAVFRRRLRREAPAPGRAQA